MPRSIQELEELLALREAETDENDPSIATLLDDLSYAYHCKGILDKAEKCYLRSLAIRESVCGKEHPSLTPSLQRLGIVYRIQGKFDKAEPLYNRVLHITERQVGLEHPLVALRLNYLAGLYYAWGKYDDAERLLMTSSYVYETCHGPRSQPLALSLMALALINLKQGKLASSKSHFRASREITGDTSSEDGQSEFQASMQSLLLLAQVHFKRREYENAEILFQHLFLVEIRELWPDHPLVRSIFRCGCGFF